jgi:hypothetical protein
MTGEREIRKIDKKIRNLKRIFIVGIIISIIGLCGIAAIMIKTGQLMQELEENDNKGFSNWTEEDDQRLSDIDRELDLMLIMNFIFGPLLILGPILAMSAFSHKRNFLKLRESFLNPPKTGDLETRDELSFIPDLSEE